VEKYPLQSELTPEEQHLLAFLRQGPRSADELATALCLNPDDVRTLVGSLDRKIGLIPLFRSGTLRYGLAE
jgi:DNA-binding CsgD family transcriptional regulator